MNLENIKKYSYYFVVGLILICGFLIRLKLLLDNPSFWFDESCLGYNIVSRNYADLFGILHLQQVAPPLFLIITKFIVNVFGVSDLNMRIFPFIIGNLAMIMFLLVLKQNFNNKLTIVLGLLLFCFNVQAIKFSIEFKPYIVEMFATALIFYVFQRLNWNYSYKKLALMGLGLAIIPWFAFISAGILTVGFLLRFSKEFYKKWLVLFSPFLVSLICLISYYLKIRNFYGEFMTNFFINSFFNFKEFFIQILVAFNFLFNLSMALVPFIIFISGLIYCVVKKKHLFLVKYVSLVFLGYIIFSFLKIYPLYDRFTLFLLPLILLLLLSVFNAIFELRKVYLTIIIMLFGIILLKPLMVFAQRAIVITYNKGSCARELFNDMSKKIKPTDIIITDTLSSPDFLYYNYYHNLKNSLYMNIKIKEGVILYSMIKHEQMPLNKELDKFIFLTWPSSDYSKLKVDYKHICPTNHGAILYMKKEK